jgi:hypothetical protein
LQADKQHAREASAALGRWTKPLSRGLFANGGRAENIARARQLLNVPAPHNQPSDADGLGDSEAQTLSHPCPCCGGRMITIETFQRGCAPRYRPTVPNRIDSS